MDTTIAAIATPAGEGGIGIIRISGPLSMNILKAIYRTKNHQSSTDFQNRRLVFGYIYNEEKKIVLDEAMVVYMKGPHTYTGEDVVEIQCHGSFVSLNNILKLVLDKGAVIAERGEFTKRAFLNGRLDLSQAEAVIDIIKAKTDRGFDVALSQLEGRLSHEIRSIREKLTDQLTLVIANIEYPDEDIEQIVYSNLIDSLIDIRSEIDRLSSSANTGRILQDGLKVVIIGKPNVGKSSLMNLFLQEERAIVTDIPGTTRDTIEELVSIRGIPVRLVDTAGIHQTDDIIEKIGIEKSKASFNDSDLVLFMVDSSEELSNEDLEIIQFLQDKKAIILLNKIDLDGCITEDNLLEHLPDAIILPMSVKNGEGFDLLQDTIESMVFRGDVFSSDRTMVTNVRHVDLLKKASQALSDAINSAHANEALDFIETDLRHGWQLLGEITGDSITDDIITEVFSRFCLGK